MTFQSGNKYEGEWKKNTRTGQGTMTWTNGNKFIGTWKENNIVSGEYIFPTGRRWRGDIENGFLCKAKLEAIGI